jgi:hypothetical protein
MAVSIASAPRANALIMTLDDLSTAGIDVVVMDNTAGGFDTMSAGGFTTIADSNPIAGVVFFVGTVGDFIVNVTTGLSRPVIGDSNHARIDLNSVNVSGAAGDLEITLTDTGFLPLNLQDSEGVVLTNEWGGTTDGRVTAQGFVDPSDTYFGSAYTTGPQGPMGPGAFADTVSIVTPAFPGMGTFSLTERVRIHHDFAGTITSFDKALSAKPVPEPATMMLLGIGLVGLAGLGRRRRRS